MKKWIRRLFPVGCIFFLWFLFCLPYAATGKIPFPSTYLVTFFPPWNATFGMPVKNNAMPDVITQIYPWKKLTIDVWKSATVPLWNPYSFAGTVHAANYQSSVFSPVNVLFFLFPFITAWSVMILLQPLIAGTGMYCFLRKIGQSGVSSLVGSIGFMGCGFITSWMAYGTLGYAVGVLPWIFYFIASDFQKKSLISRLLLSFCIAFSFLSGHFQISVYVFAAAVGFIIFEALSKKRYARGFVLLLYCICGIMIAAPQIFPTLYAYALSTRSTSFIKGEVIPWQYCITTLIPDFFGNPVTRNDWFGHYAEWGSYIGVAPLLLALLAIVSSLRGYKKFFVCLALVSVILSYPTPLNDVLFKLRLPAISTSAASRIIVLLSFSFAVLSAFGLTTLRELWQSNKKKPVLIASGIVSLILCVIWFTLIVVKPFTAERLLIAERNSVLPSMLAVITLVLFVVGFVRRTTLRKIAVLCVIAICMFDSYRFVSKWMPADRKEYMYPATKSLSFLQTKIGNDRVFGNIGNEVGTMFSLPLIEGYDAMYQGRYGEFLKAVSQGFITQGDRSVVQFDKYGIYKTEALQLLGVRYIYHRISDGQNTWAFPYWEYLEDSSMRSIYRDEHYEIFEFTKAFPRTFLASSYVLAPNDQGIIDTLFAPDIDRRETLVLEEKPALEPKAGDGKADIISYTPDQVIIHTESGVPKLLYLSDVFDEGWIAKVDGVKTKIYRADYDFRAIEVPNGVHNIEFSYMPSSFVAGVVTCGVACLILGIMCIMSKKRI